MTKKPTSTCQRVPVVPELKNPPGSNGPGPVSKYTCPSRKLISEKSKLRVGPAGLRSTGWLSFGDSGNGSLGRGYGMKSGWAAGIGLELFGLVLDVNPEKPSSSPVTVPLTATDPFGSTSEPKVRCLSTS